MLVFAFFSICFLSLGMAMLTMFEHQELEAMIAQNRELKALHQMDQFNMMTQEAIHQHQIANMKRPELVIKQVAPVQHHYMARPDNEKEMLQHQIEEGIIKAKKFRGAADT